MRTEQAYGVIVVYKGEQNLFLLLKQSERRSKGSWSFPKGHHEENETPKQTALREIKEETGIIEVEFLDTPLIHEEYKFATFNKERYHKNVDYFIGVVKDKVVVIQESEIDMYKWATYEEALEILEYKERKETLKKAQEYLTAYESGK